MQTNEERLQNEIEDTTQDQAQTAEQTTDTPHADDRSALLAERVALLEEENDALRAKVDRIRNNPLWKASLPVRAIVHNVNHNIQRVKRQGSPAGVVRKLKSKREEKKLRVALGTKSFPDEATREAQAARVFTPAHTFSILTPLYNTPERFLRDMIESVLSQTYQRWELCLCDASDDAHAYVGRIVAEYAENEKKLRDGESRIRYQKLEKNGGISRNTNACLALATGDYVGLLDHDDILHPEVLYLYAEQIEIYDADYLYCDETTFSGSSIDRMITLHFKPDYAIDNLRANNYICHFSVFRKSLLDDEPEALRPQFDGSQDHDLILRLTDRAERIVHVPRVLYYWRSHSGSTAARIEAKTYAIDAAKGAVRDHLRRNGFRNFRISSTRAFETIFKISYEIEGEPKISIVVPSRDHAQDLRRLIDSILEKSTWGNYQILVIENGSTEQATFDYYKELEEGIFDRRVAVKYYFEKPEEAETGEVRLGFNYADVMNFGVSCADGDYVLLLNNDMEVQTANWMEELLMYAQREDVGAVGARLLFPDNTVQHGGVIVGLGQHHTAGHAHYGQPAENLGYMGRLCYAQNMCAVTAACMMIKKSKFEEVGGFDTKFAISLNDVDLCLRLRGNDYLNVFTPFATLTHYESKSRGSDLGGENAVRYEREASLFRAKWKELLEEGDPYYNPNLTLEKSDFSLKEP